MGNYITYNLMVFNFDLQYCVVKKTENESMVTFSYLLTFVENAKRRRLKKLYIIYKNK